jgi:hypothetical protein
VNDRRNLPTRTVDVEDVKTIIGAAYNLITQGESPMQRRQPSAQTIYETAYKMLGEPCPLERPTS